MNESTQILPEDAENVLNDFLVEDRVFSTSTRYFKTFTYKTKWIKIDLPSSVRSTSLNYADSIALYVFEMEDGGYAIVSGDKRIPGVLAFSNKGIYNDCTGTGLDFFSNILPVYVNETIMQFELTKDSLIQNVRDKVNSFLNSSIESCQDTRSYTSMGMEPLMYIERIRYDWVTLQDKWSLLKTKWDQNNPYNKELNTIICSGSPWVPYVGCVAVAVGQIMSHHKYPSYFGGNTYNWGEMTRYPKATQLNNTYQTQIALLLKQIGSYVNMQYECSGSGSNIYNANSAFQTYGYQTGGVQNYSLSVVRSSIANNRPVYIRGSLKDEPIGHAWVIDGTKIREKKDLERLYVYTGLPGTSPSNPFDRSEWTMVSEEYYFTYENYVLCNYGYSGFFDGYYNSGVFDLIDNSLGFPFTGDSYNRDLTIISQIYK